jgi:hypothetical protein
MRQVCVPARVVVSSDPDPVSLHGRRALVLGGSVFVGRHLVDALVRRGAEVAVLNRGQTQSVLPDGVERLVADRTDAAQMSAALAGRRWDAVFDVSGFVMAAGGSDIEGLLDLLDGQVGAYVYTSRSWRTTNRGPGCSRTEDQPTNSDGRPATGTRAGRGLDPGAVRATGFPGGRQAAAIHGPTSTTWNSRCPAAAQHRPILPHGGSSSGTPTRRRLCDAMIAAAITPEAALTRRPIQST